MIAYTIGSTQNYNLAIQQDPNVTKIGRTLDYKGGWVWRTKEEASSFIQSVDFNKVDWEDGLPRDPKNFSVYGLKLSSWEEDVYFSDEDKQNYLLHDAKLFIL